MSATNAKSTIAIDVLPTHKTAGPSASCVEMGSTWRTQHAHSVPRVVSNVPLQAIVYLVRVAM